MNLLRQQNYNETIYIHGSLEKLCEYYSNEKINHYIYFMFSYVNMGG